MRRLRGQQLIRLPNEGNRTDVATCASTLARHPASVMETHGRRKVAELIDGIEVIPPQHLSYRGTLFPELDVEAVLQRRPEVALVDEYAHSNIPGSVNSKRWQDIETLLDAGITGISTLNIQHLESLNDVVAQITGVEQRETVPDEI